MGANSKCMALIINFVILCLVVINSMQDDYLMHYMLHGSSVRNIFGIGGFFSSSLSNFSHNTILRIIIPVGIMFIVRNVVVSCIFTILLALAVYQNTSLIWIINTGTVPHIPPKAPVGRDLIIVVLPMAIFVVYLAVRILSAFTRGRSNND
jgi:hypothetical protein